MLSEVELLTPQDLEELRSGTILFHGQLSGASTPCSNNGRSYIDPGTSIKDLAQLALEPLPASELYHGSPRVECLCGPNSTVRGRRSELETCRCFGWDSMQAAGAGGPEAFHEARFCL